MAVVAADIHAIFGRNLRRLIGSGTSVSEVARDIGINRTQLSRYLYGEAFPRPDVLHRICVHFDVDARILTEPLENTAQVEEESPEELHPFSDLVFDPVSSALLPDGFYNEWKTSWTLEGYYTKQILLVHTQNGVRKVKVKHHEKLKNEPTGPRYELPVVEHRGVAVAQPDGFALIDQGRGLPGIAMAVFRHGFLDSETLYPGYKLSALVFNRTRHHFKGPAILERIEQTPRAVLAHARSPVWHVLNDLPADIRMAFQVLQSEDELAAR